MREMGNYLYSTDSAPFSQLSQPSVAEATILVLCTEYKVIENRSAALCLLMRFLSEMHDIRSWERKKDLRNDVLQ